ncbi:MAG: DUF484 family protein [bacterium]
MNKSDSENFKNYLLSHPDFFIENPDAFAMLQLPAEDNGTVSFVQFQIDALKKELASQNRHYNELLITARQNQELFTDLYKMGLEMAFSSSPQQAFEQLRTHLLARPGIDQLVMWSNSTAIPQSLLIEDSPHEHMLQLLDSDKTFCGHLSAKKTAIYFPDNPQSLRSCALLPICQEEQKFILCMGSADQQRFHINMDTSLLQFISPAIKGVLARLENA